MVIIVSRPREAPTAPALGPPAMMMMMEVGIVAGGVRIPRHEAPVVVGGRLVWRVFLTDATHPPATSNDHDAIAAAVVVVVFSRPALPSAGDHGLPPVVAVTVLGGKSSNCHKR
jgi:hypothetical protein